MRNNQTYTPYKHAVILASFQILALSFSSSASIADTSISYPKLKVSTLLSTSEFKGGERATVTVNVTGDTQQQKSPIPIALALILDRSGSMVQDHAIDALMAASHQVIDTLQRKSPLSEVAVVAFSDYAETISRFDQGFQSALNSVSNLKAKGGTNIYAGLATGGDLLRYSNVPVRLGILFTDGVPDSPNQAKDISNYLDGLSSEHLAINTIGLGAINSDIIRGIAERTGGHFYSAPSPADISKLMNQIVADEASAISTSSVTINESITPPLSVVDGSFSRSVLPTSLPEDYFNQTMQSRIDGFYQNGNLSFPTIPELPANVYFSYSYDVKVSACNENNDIVLPLRTATASIKLYDGHRDAVSRSLDNPTLTILKCGIYLDKQWNESERELTIELVNSTNHPARNVIVADVLHPTYFRLDPERDQGNLPPPSGPIPGKEESIYWDLGTIDAGGRVRLAYHVKETRDAQKHRNPIERDDAWTTMRYEVPVFSVTHSEPSYVEFARTLDQPGPISAVTLQTIASKLRIRNQLTTGSASLSTPDRAAAGYAWTIELNRNELGDLAEPRPLGSGVLATEKNMGRYLVRSVDGEFEISEELERQQLMPHRDTTDAFEPMP